MRMSVCKTVESHESQPPLIAVLCGDLLMGLWPLDMVLMGQRVCKTLHALLIKTPAMNLVASRRPFSLIAAADWVRSLEGSVELRLIDPWCLQQGVRQSYIRVAIASIQYSTGSWGGPTVLNLSNCPELGEYKVLWKGLVRNLSKRERCRNLVHLDLSGCHLFAEGVHYVAQALSRGELDSLKSLVSLLLHSPLRCMRSACMHARLSVMVEAL